MAKATAAQMKPANPAMRVPDFNEEDEFELIDLSKKPEGMSYEWKRYSILGKVDTKHLAKLKRTGWTEVPAARHPEQFGEDAEGSAIDNDRILMERPEEWTQASRANETKKARANILTQQERLKIGSHEMMPRLKPNARRTYEQVDVPPDDRGDPNEP